MSFTGTVDGQPVRCLISAEALDYVVGTAIRPLDQAFAAAREKIESVAAERLRQRLPTDGWLFLTTMDFR